MKSWEASVEVNGALEKLQFEAENPVEWIWQRYGMCCYIEYVKEVEEK